GPVTSTMCTYAYTPWSACGSDGTQTRSVMSATPSGCTGTPALTQSCVSAPPPPASTTLAAPSNLRVSSGYLLSNPYPASDPQPDFFTVTINTRAPITVPAQQNADGSTQLDASLASFSLTRASSTPTVVATNSTSAIPTSAST